MRTHWGIGRGLASLVLLLSLVLSTFGLAFGGLTPSASAQTVASLDVTPNPAVTGDTLTVTGTTVGGMTGDAVAVGVYSDDACTMSVATGSGTVTTDTGDFTGTVTAPTTAGTYYVGATAAGDTAVTTCTPIVVNDAVVPTSPTLTLGAPGAADPGAPVTVTGTVDNPDGVALDSANAAVYSDAACTMPIINGTATVDSNTAVTAMVTAPDAAGTYYVGATVNAADGSTSTDCVPLVVNAVNPPTIPTVTITDAPTTVNPGDPVAVGGTVDNPSNLALGNGTVGIYNDAACTDPLAEGNATVDPATGAVTGDVNAPTTAGDYYLGVSVDVTDLGTTITDCQPITVNATNGGDLVDGTVVVIKVDTNQNTLQGACFTLDLTPTVNGVDPGLDLNTETTGESCTGADGTVTVSPVLTNLVDSINALGLSVADRDALVGNISVDVTTHETVPPTGFMAAPDTTATVSLGDVLSGNATVTVMDEAASPSASASASASSSASASASASPSLPPYDGGIVENGAAITGAFREDASKAGEYEYYYDFTSAAATNDLRLAGEGEMTFQVLVESNGQLFLVDQGSTDANGMVTLDIPTDADYFIAEIGDTGANYGSDTIAAGQTANFLVIEYVASITPSASASGSTSGSASGSAAPSASNGGGNIGSGTGNGGTGTGTGNTGGVAGNGNAGAGTGGTGNGSGTGSGATSLPNTGSGAATSGSSFTWELMALLAMVGAGAAVISTRRRAA